MKQNDLQHSSPQATVAIDGSKIKQIRESKGLTQDYLATVVGVAIRTVSCWENTRSPNIKRENAESVAKALEVPLEDILTRQALPYEKSRETTDSKLTEKDSSEAEPGQQAPLKKKQKAILLIVFIALFLIIAVIVGHEIFSDKPPVDQQTEQSKEEKAPSQTDMGMSPPQGSIRAVRYLPDHTPPGQPFPVVIKVRSSFTAPTSFLLKEFLPPACTVIRGEATADLQNSSPYTVKWVSKIAGQEKSRFAYLVRCDASLTQEQGGTFSGKITVKANNIQRERSINGDRTITITDYHWADNNQDHRIDDNEILAFYTSFDILKELGVDVEEIRRAWSNSKGNHWDSEQKKFMVLGKPCGQSWKTPLNEINGVIQAVHAGTSSGDEQNELLLDVITQQGTVIVHVFPRRCIENTPGKFTLIQQQKMFRQGDPVQVVGSEFQSQQHRNICAAEIVSDNYTFTRSTKNELRDLATGALNGEMCRSGATEQEQQLVYARYTQPRGKKISWHLAIPQAPPAVVILIQNIPPGTTLLTSSPSFHSYDQEAGTVKWLLTDLQPGEIPMHMELDTPILKKGEISGEILFEDRTEDPIFWLF